MVGLVVFCLQQMWKKMCGSWMNDGFLQRLMKNLRLRKELPILYCNLSDNNIGEIFVSLTKLLVWLGLFVVKVGYQVQQKTLKSVQQHTSLYYWNAAQVQ
jgi:hypothetical protein